MYEGKEIENSSEHIIHYLIFFAIPGNGLHWVSLFLRIFLYFLVDSDSHDIIILL
jgi:hypothetical protein